MHHLVLIFVLLFSIINTGNSQENKIYFSKVGKSASESNALYYRIHVGNNSYKSYYVNGESQYFEGVIVKPSDTDENLNVYSGECTWYYKGGGIKAVRTFNSEGKEDGTSIYYFESGGVEKEISFVNGQEVKGKKIVYNEDGTKFQVFRDDFDDNYNDWDLYHGDNTGGDIDSSKLIIYSYTEAGASRFISIPHESESYILEVAIDRSYLEKPQQKTGILYGFKDWNNYSYFSISNQYLFAGVVFEGIAVKESDGIYCPSINPKGNNIVKIFANGEKLIFSVNGEVQYSSPQYASYGKNYGFAFSGEGMILVDYIEFKELIGAGRATKSADDAKIKSTGSGSIISSQGHVLTNHHVIKGGKKITIEITNGGNVGNYAAKVIGTDEQNDLALLLIDDPNFKEVQPIPFTFMTTGNLDVGTSVFTLGYPLALSGMGKEVKFTDGRISSKSGYKQNINSYQTSIPVQPGNSGGPVFNNNGEIIGIVNARYHEADNASYVIKTMYIVNLIDTYLSDFTVNNTPSQIETLALEEKIKLFSPYVVLVKIE